jgi:hypothetical protein
MRSSPRADGSRSCGGKGKTTTIGGGEDRVLAGRDVAGTLRAPGHHGSTCGGSCEGARGLEESEDHRRPRKIMLQHECTNMLTL